MLARAAATLRSSPVSRQMATQAVQGATLRTPKGFEKVIAVKLGWGVDMHGQDPTEAARRAIQNALHNSSLPAVMSIVPGGFDKVKIRAKISVPDNNDVDKEALKKEFPYGNVTIKTVHGGHRAHAGIIYPKAGDPQSKEEVDADTSGDEAETSQQGHKARDEMFVAVASVRIGY